MVAMAWDGVKLYSGLNQGLSQNLCVLRSDCKNGREYTSFASPS